MTHGDQAKAKAAKSSQASGNQKSSPQTAGKAVQSGKAGQGGGKEGGAGSKGAPILVKAGPEKGGSPAAPKAGAGAAKEAGNGGKGKGRPVPPPAADTTTGFSNPAVANAFKRALKKYPNAFRKLTD
jgi:hypothetical protein